MLWVLKDSKIADMDLISVSAFSMALPLAVVSKCALAGRKKPPLCKGRWLA